MHIDEFLSKIQAYKNNLDISLIEKACYFANSAHKGQKRHSGKDYITHPLNIAFNLIEYKLDIATIVAAILHDVLEDTEVSEEELKKEFGTEVFKLVQGVTKLSKFQFDAPEESKLENFRRFILAFIEDIRILYIKIFDRLDNMRTLKHIKKSEKRQRIAKETLDVYVPLIERLSLKSIKEEIENLAFAEADPSSYKFILSQIDDLKTSSLDFFLKIQDEATKLLKKEKIEFTITGRIKTPYSIWRKMRRKNLSFIEITDLYAMKIVLKDIPTVYHVLGIIHGKYKAIFSRFKDYISYPKSNNYQSVHTCILVKDKKVEFQIKTTEMDYFAKHGIAAHWNYKNPVLNKNVQEYKWLETLHKIITSHDTSMEDLYEYSRTAFFADEVFVFTPTGEIISLPKGSCVLDFAYAIHSQLGNRCDRAIIDGKTTSILAQLKNGQKVEIITDNAKEPQAYWLSYVKTGLAKLSIKRFLKEKYRNDTTKQAYSILEYMFDKEKLTFYPEMVAKMVKILNIKKDSVFFEAIVDGKINITNLISKLYPNLLPERINNYKNAVSINLDIPDKDIHFAKCCYTLYGDTILSVLLPAKKVEVHHSDCNILLSNSNLPVVKTKWLPNNHYAYKVKVCIILKHEKGALLDIAKIVFSQDIQIHSIITELEQQGQRKLNIIVNLYDKDELKKLLKTFNTSKYVIDAYRLIN